MLRNKQAGIRRASTRALLSSTPECREPHGCLGSSIAHEKNTSAPPKKGRWPPRDNPGCGGSAASSCPRAWSRPPPVGRLALGLEARPLPAARSRKGPFFVVAMSPCLLWRNAPLALREGQPVPAVVTPRLRHVPARTNYGPWQPATGAVAATTEKINLRMECSFAHANRLQRRLDEGSPRVRECFEDGGRTDG